MNSVPAAKLDSDVSRPQRHALPAWVYGHPDLTRLEIERVILPSWQIVCHVNSIPRPGDYETLDVGPESVFVLRDKDGSIKAFHNVCRHRGARILDGAGSCPATITCPYHGWSYRQDGSLIGVPMRESFPDLDRAEHGLRPVRVDMALGFVFVCLSGDPPPVAKTWGKLGEELAPYRFEDMVPLAPITTDVWNVDWKIAMDNYLESYHVPIGHPGLYRMFTPDYEDQASVPGVARGIELDARSALLALVGAHVSVDHRQSGPPICPRTCAAAGAFTARCPNLGIDVFPDQMDFFQLLPGRARQVHRARHDLRPARTRAAKCAPRVFCRIASTSRSTTRTSGCARGCSAAWPPAATSRARCRTSRAGCRIPQSSARADSGISPGAGPQAIRLRPRRPGYDVRPQPRLIQADLVCV